MVVNSRFKIYLDYLETHYDYAQVFICDTRDVIFQGDVFAPFKDYKIWLGYTTEALTIGEDIDYDYLWLVGRFGKAEADKIAEKKIICAGTVIGSSDAMKIFCRKMWELIQHATKNTYDQATMNYLVWNNLLPIENLLELDVQSGEIFTAGLFYDLYPPKIRGDKILRGDDGVPAVVHQYDRHKESTLFVDKIYRDKNFTVDDRFNDWRSRIDQIKYLLYKGRSDEAIQLLTKSFSTEKNSSESVYGLIKLWEFVLKGNLNSSTENFELAIQSVIASHENLPEEHLSFMYYVIVAAMKKNRLIAVQIKEYFTRHLLPVAQRNLDHGNAQACLNCINFLEALNTYKS